MFLRLKDFIYTLKHSPFNFFVNLFCTKTRNSFKPFLSIPTSYCSFLRSFWHSRSTSERACTKKQKQKKLILMMIMTIKTVHSNNDGNSLPRDCSPSNSNSSSTTIAVWFIQSLTLDLNIIHQKKGKIYIFKVTANSFPVYGTLSD